MSIPMPRIEVTRCTGCARCVDACPTEALALTRGKARLQYPAWCTYCAACQHICPHDAIALPFLIVFAAQDKARDGLAGQKGMLPCPNSAR